MMVPTSPAKLVEVRVSGLESPFVEQKDKRGRLAKIFSCCYSSQDNKMDPVYYDENFVVENGPFKPTQSCGQSTSPPSPLLMSSYGKFEEKNSVEEGNEDRNATNNCSEGKEESGLVISNNSKSCLM